MFWRKQIGAHVGFVVVQMLTRTDTDAPGAYQTYELLLADGTWVKHTFPADECAAWQAQLGQGQGSVLNTL
ncbi:hypothetical protein [Paraburkholderia megapolitana]|uniref:hypothetical protein n=1 Tax=Paraburkholderia megapolitana TaxID=420953 RepID=UPI0038B9D8EE